MANRKYKRAGTIGTEVLDLSSLPPAELLAHAQVLQTRCARLRLRYNGLLKEFERQALMVYTDALTGVHNRRGFDEELEREVRRVLRGDGIPLTLLVLDLDFFKRHNDTYGHAAGDTVLRHIGKCLQAEVRGSDYSARIGGEEFAIIFRQTPLEMAAVIAERLRGRIESLELRVSTKKHNTKIVRVTASLGLAVWQAGETPKEGESAESLLARADRALYTAKEQGRNQLVVAP